MMLFNVFAPYLLAFSGAIVWCLAFAYFAGPRALPFAAPSLPLYFLLFLIAVGLTPSSWIWAKATPDQDADVAIILSFGYEMDGEQMKPGEANHSLWNWIADDKPSQIKTVFVQEGVWVAVDEGTLQSLDIDRKRIHQHDPSIYVDTLDAAFCAIQQLRKMDKKKALLVAHDLQLQRVAWDFERVRQIACPDCEFVIPEIRNIPFPANSVHWQTRNEFIYKIVELLIARPRDFLSPIPVECKAPLNLD